MDFVLLADDVFGEASRLGFEGVELTVTREQLLATDESRIAELRRDAAAAGVELHSIVMGEHNAHGIAAPDTQAAAAAAEDVRMAVDLAAGVGADAILVPFFLDAEVHTDADLDRCADAFRAACPYAAERGVTLCFEGLLPAARLRELAARVESPAFACYFDLANPLMRGLDPATELRETGALVHRVHMKDMLARPRDARVGEGRVDFAACARVLDEIGYDGWLTLETPTGPPPFVARDLSYTRTVFPELGAPPWPRLAVQVGGAQLDELLADPDAASTIRERGVEVTSIASGRALVDPDEAARKENVDHVRRCLELAPALGTFVVSARTGTLASPGANWSRDAVALLDAAIEELLPVAERTGTMLALAGAVGDVLQTTSQVVDVLGRFSATQLGLVCDPSSYVSRHLQPVQREATADFLERFEDRFLAARVTDVDEAYLAFLHGRRPDIPLVLDGVSAEEARRLTTGSART
jgi:sugar phosphate isomerase/epimerase